MPRKQKAVALTAAVLSTSMFWLFPAPAQAVCVDDSNPDPIHGCSMCYPTYEDVGPVRVPTGYYCLHNEP
ncbi:MAG: hypothetical protein M3323_01500 [Actinomycetota bacterium]|nr:hypothetical protein [Actinomycetota bacterium]